MRAKIFIISFVSVVIIALTIFLSVYFCIGIDVNKQIEEFFAIDGELEYYYGTTGEEIVLDSTIEEYIINEIKDLKFRNTVYRFNSLGGGVLLYKNKDSLLFYGKRVFINNKWYKTNKHLSTTIANEIYKQINK